MIKKFQEYISEGLWKPAIQRTKSGEKRIGDRMNSNISNMVAIDVGMKIEIADIDLEIEGEEQFTWGHLYEVYDQVLKLGWRLPTKSEIDRILSKFIFYSERTDDDKKLIYFKSKKNQVRDIKVDMCVLDKEYRDSGVRYWFEPIKGMKEEYKSSSPYKDDTDWSRRILYIATFLRWGSLRDTSIIFPDKPETMKCRVRLVRDKQKQRKQK